MARMLVEAPAGDSLNSDVVLILAGLLCALACVLGLGLVARCACSRRWTAAAAREGERTPQEGGPGAASRGVRKEVLRSLPTVTYVSDRTSKKAAADDEADECAICLAEFEDGQAMRVLPRCGHGFHAACVDTWLRSRSSCPSCRRRVLAADLPPGERCRPFGALRKAHCTAVLPTLLA